MKSSRNARQPYGGLDRRTDRRGGKRQGSEKTAKLDRKSSRGMIYENEELRLRTININAEVERGQSDIKRLRRENEHLRREIWTLRDEYDRLNKRFKAKLIDHNDHCGCGGSVRCSGESCTVRGSNGAGGGYDSHSNSEDSDSCDTCRAAEYDDDVCSDDCTCQQAGKPGSMPLDEGGNSAAKQMVASDGNSEAAVTTSTTPMGTAESTAEVTTGFDHLSVVSEETLSNIDLHATPTQQHTDNMMGHLPPLQLNTKQLPLASGFIGPLTPLTPIELVANQLNDMQAVVPPLSYFENVLQQHMVPAGPSPESVSMEARMRQTNGWDYNLESPFAQRKFHPIGGKDKPAPHTTAPSVTLTTFVPTSSQQAPPLPIIKLPDGEILNTASTVSAIEMVAITTMPTNTQPQHGQFAPTLASSPKHFFSPLKPRLKLNTALANKNLVAVNVPAVPPIASVALSVTESAQKTYDSPDLCVTNGLASPYQRPAVSQSQSTTPPPLPQRSTSQTSSQTDSVNLKSILNEIETISEDILAIQMEKAKSRENLNEAVAVSGSVKPLQLEDKSNKPYRSEMNLLLSYDGSNPTITPANTATKSSSSITTPSATQTSIDEASGNRARSLERDLSESPSVSVPDPMIPFPPNRTYIGFEQFDRAVTMAPVSASGGGTQKPPVPTSVVPGETRLGIMLKSPPTPPTRHQQFPKAIAMTSAQLNLRSASDMQARVGLAPNKSHLYTVIANAAAKRAQFRAASAATQSLNEKVETEATQTELNSDNAAKQSPSRSKDNETDDAAAAASEMARKKARRVSIICGDASVATPTVAVASVEQPADNSRSQAQNAQSTLSLPIITMSLQSTETTASCMDLSTVALQNPVLKCLKQHLSHSTPNSPHSSRRRRSNSNSMTVPNPTPEHQSGGSQRKASQDSTDLANVAALAVARTRCCRRHSEGTIAAQQQQRISVASSSHHHHHHQGHHHHHHQHHSTLLGGINPHHSHHSHQDSNHETGTSLSDPDHMSNSLASSRESSTTFSMRSQRRKISISSHTGGKIPWCGCWGNGCL